MHLRGLSGCPKKGEDFSSYYGVVLTNFECANAPVRSFVFFVVVSEFEADTTVAVHQVCEGYTAQMTNNTNMVMSLFMNGAMLKTLSRRAARRVLTRGEYEADYFSVSLPTFFSGTHCFFFQTKTILNSESSRAQGRLTDDWKYVGYTKFHGYSIALCDGTELGEILCCLIAQIRPG